MKNIFIFFFLTIPCATFAQQGPRIRAALIIDTSFFSADATGSLFKIREKVYRLPDSTLQKVTDVKPVFRDSVTHKSAQNEYKRQILEKNKQIERLKAEIKKIQDESKFVDDQFDQRKKGVKKDASAPVDNPKINLNPVSKPAPDVKINLETGGTNTKPSTKTKKTKKQ